MIESGGLLYAAFLLSLATLGMSSLFVLFAWLLTRRNRRQRPLLLAIAFLLPVLGAASLWLFRGVLPERALFGALADVDQPLPNGYRLTAEVGARKLATISKDGTPVQQLNGHVGSLAVDGPLVWGRYHQGVVDFFVGQSEPYFLLDTRSGSVEDFSAYTSFEQLPHHPPTLVDSGDFVSNDLRHLRQVAFVRNVLLVLPTLAAIGFFAFLFERRLRGQSA